MSLLQIKRLEAPLELRRESTGVSSSTATGDATFKPTDEGVFTCYFGRTIEAADYSPSKTTGADPCVEITVRIYDERGKLVSTVPLEASQVKVQAANSNCYICFKLSMSDTDFQQLSGSHIYVFASISSSTVSFKEEYLGNWHDTISLVFLYDQEGIENVYWSSQHHINEMSDLTKKEAEITKLEELNKDAQIHVKVKGLCGKVVKLYIYADGLDDFIATIDASVYRNRKVITLSPKYLIACYCAKTEVEYKENDDIDLKFKLKVVYEYNDKDGKSCKIEKESEKLQLICKMEKVDAIAVNGSVYVEVGSTEVAITGPERYKDFHIGYICHIEGVGKMVNRYENHKTDKPKFSVYPFHTYEIQLSDLVKCGLITVEDAEKISSTFNADTAKFHKDNAILSNGKKLIEEIFIDKLSYKRNNKAVEVAKKEAIRKVLTQVSKTEVFSSIDLLYICRDAWQFPTDWVEDTSIAEKDRYKKTTTKVTTIIVKDGDNLKQTVKTEVTTQEGKSGTPITTTTEVETVFSTEADKKGKKVGTTTKTTVIEDFDQTPQENRSEDRYNKSNECPFGTYFLNFAEGQKYDSKVSWKALQTQDIGVYDANTNNGLPESPNRVNRNAIALHRGGATASMGCLTFNVGYYDNNATKKKGRYVEFDNNVFANQNYLNFICIDERNAAKTANATEKAKKRSQKVTNGTPKNTDKTDEVTFDDNRYYDLIDPKGNKK